MLDTPKGFITIQEAAHILNVSHTWVYKLIQAGRLTKYKRMGRTLLSEKEVRELGETYAENAYTPAQR